MIECVSLENEDYNIKLPQVRFVDRISNVIDLAGFTRITKATIDKAVEIGKLPVKDWVASKQYEAKEPVLHVYMEMLETDVDVNDVKNILNESLRRSDSDYRDIQMMLGRDPLRVTLLPRDSFNNYSKKSNNTILKMNPAQENLEKLLNCS